MRKSRQTVFYDGLSESLWKSLAVKSLRLGWPAGLEAAASKLSKSTMQAMLVCGVFEDVFPPMEELRTVMGEIKRGDYHALCARETHHGQGLTAEFCDYEQQAVYAATYHKPDIWQIANENFQGLWLPPRSLNCFWTWWQMSGKIKGGTREVDTTLFVGIPQAMADGHTLEGKQSGTTITVLSGHYAQHRLLGQMVAERGWAEVRRLVHEQAVIKADRQEQSFLF